MNEQQRKIAGDLLCQYNVKNWTYDGTAYHFRYASSVEAERDFVMKPLTNGDVGLFAYELRNTFSVNQE